MEEKKTEIECCSEECVHEDLLKIVNAGRNRII